MFWFRIHRVVVKSTDSGVRFERGSNLSSVIPEMYALGLFTKLPWSSVTSCVKRGLIIELIGMWWEFSNVMMWVLLYTCKAHNKFPVDGSYCYHLKSKTRKCKRKPGREWAAGFKYALSGFSTALQFTNIQKNILISWFPRSRLFWNKESNSSFGNWRSN